MKKIILLSFISAICFGCGRFDNKDEKQENKERIVLISKQYCEIIHALNAEENVVAVDISSVYPPKVKELPTVGYHRALSLEGLLAAKPTLIMHNGLKSLGPDHIVKQLQDLQIPMKEFDTKSEDIESTKALIQEMGNYFKKTAKADSLCTKLDADMKLAMENVTQYVDTPKVLVIHFGRASNVYLVMTKKGTAAKMVEWAGGTMAVTDTSGMRHLSAEVVTQYDPDVILLTDFGYDRLGSNEKIQELPGVSSTTAARNNKIYRVNECDLVYLGPRTGEITLELQKLIHQ
ncbi:MAG: ABC transporter substrate-binding protein [Vicingus serpentipes]|nr:ABC transporter substrate-binding protein [Vicingus serpentipes]